MARELNTEGIALADFDKDPILRQRLKEFRHHYGQPAEVRRAFAEAMGIGGITATRFSEGFRGPPTRHVRQPAAPRPHVRAQLGVRGEATEWA